MEDGGGFAVEGGEAALFLKRRQIDTQATILKAQRLFRLLHRLQRTANWRDPPADARYVARLSAAAIAVTTPRAEADQY